ncbi:MAG: nuclear transport factor 2 family protein [Paracoccaceae bacterium]|nr:nuclear transport factor 2 family protein [Paracoccaceae bacterium]
MTPQEKVKKVKRYFELMTASDIDGITALFDANAHVLSPFLGKMDASEFFKKLGNTSDASKLTVFDVLLGENGDSAAAHFEYDWTLKSGEQFTFQGVDYFKFSEDGRFSSMSIFYDTHPVREDVGDKYASA